MNIYKIILKKTLTALLSAAAYLVSYVWQYGSNNILIKINAHIYTILTAFFSYIIFGTLFQLYLKPKDQFPF